MFKEATVGIHLRSDWKNGQGVTSHAKLGGWGPSFEAEGLQPPCHPARASAEDSERKEPGMSEAHTGSVTAVE